MYGHIEIARFLIAENADIDSDSNGWTPLFFACRGRRIEIACLLISKGADHLLLDNNGSSAFDQLRRVNGERVFEYDEHAAKAEVEQAVRDYTTLRACVPILK